MINSLYIHIPFCKKKCNYCDFVSYAGKEGLIDEYVDALIKEINSPPLSPSLNKRGGNRAKRGGGEFETIYFGGGTPTLLKTKHFEQIMNNINSAFSIRHSAFEISVEANPGTINKPYLKALKDLGVNRLSLGAQTFNDKHLKTLGRIHSSKDIYEAFEDARAAGFENLNLDLIFCLPGQTLEEWKEDLKKALDLGPNHLSTYNLQYEEGTPIWDSLNPHPLSPSPTGRGGTKGGEGLLLPSEDLDAEMYEYTIDILKDSGFHHYEISNFARLGYECKHNLAYWKNENYLGIGCAAHSHVNGKRWANPDPVEAYIGCGGVGRNVIRLTSDDSLNATVKRDTLFMGLRLIDGIDIKHFKGFQDKLNDLLNQNLLKKQGKMIRLSRKGLFLANLVFEHFI